MGGPYLISLLLGAILFVIYGTARLKVHPFLVLLVTSYAVGLAGGLSAAETVSAIAGGFGATIGYIGIVIAAGTIIGAVLERNGGAALMAAQIVRWVGKARSMLAMSITGAVVSIPVFCDSGYIILSPLSRSLARASGHSLAAYAVALSMGLYATHVFVPPTPGPIAAAGELGADIGLVILLGLAVTVPVIFSTYAFARFMGGRIFIDPDEAGPDGSAAEKDIGDSSEAADHQVSTLGAFLPVVIPVLLIAMQSIANLPARPLGEEKLFESLAFLGNPTTALLIGVLIAFITTSGPGAPMYGEWVGKALLQAGVIILITGAGGAFGRVLQETPIGGYLGEMFAAAGLGTLSIVIPFLLGAALKTSLGSSTVAIITSASILAPLLPGMDLTGPIGTALATLAIGAGSMTVSHANDSYFWVVSQFSGMTVSEAYRLQTAGSAVAGVTGLVAILVLSAVLR